MGRWGRGGVLEKPWDLSPPQRLHSPVMTEPRPPSARPTQVALAPLLPGGAAPGPSVPRPTAPRPTHGVSRFPPTARPEIRVNDSNSTDGPLRVTAKAGDEVTLDCEARGSPPPLVTWIKDSRPGPLITDR